MDDTRGITRIASFLSHRDLLPKGAFFSHHAEVTMRLSVFSKDPNKTKAGTFVQKWPRDRRYQERRRADGYMQQNCRNFSLLEDKDRLERKVFHAQLILYPASREGGNRRKGLICSYLAFLTATRKSFLSSSTLAQQLHLDHHHLLFIPILTI